MAKSGPKTTRRDLFRGAASAAAAVVVAPGAVNPTDRAAAVLPPVNATPVERAVFLEKQGMIRGPETLKNVVIGDIRDSLNAMAKAAETTPEIIQQLQKLLDRAQQTFRYSELYVERPEEPINVGSQEPIFHLQHLLILSAYLKMIRQDHPDLVQVAQDSSQFVLQQMKQLRDYTADEDERQQGGIYTGFSIASTGFGVLRTKEEDAAIILGAAGFDLGDFITKIDQRVDALSENMAGRLQDNDKLKMRILMIMHLGNMSDRTIAPPIFPDRSWYDHLSALQLDDLLPRLRISLSSEGKIGAEALDDSKAGMAGVVIGVVGKELSEDAIGQYQRRERALLKAKVIEYFVKNPIPLATSAWSNDWYREKEEEQVQETYPWAFQETQTPENIASVAQAIDTARQIATLAGTMRTGLQIFAILKTLDWSFEAEEVHEGEHVSTKLSLPDPNTIEGQIVADALSGLDGVMIEDGSVVLEGVSFDDEEPEVIPVEAVELSKA